MKKAMIAVALGATALGGVAFAAQQSPAPAARGMHGGGGMMMMADANKDGVLTRAELLAQVDAKFAKADTDRNGQLSEAERKAAHEAMRAEMKTRMQARKTEMLGKYDANKDGKLDTAERQAMRQAFLADHPEMAAKRKEMRDQRFSRMDTDKNGQISRSEFDAARGQGFEGRGGPGHEGRHGGKHGGKWDGKRGDMMAKLDTNKDGQISLAEMRAQATTMFDRVDANKDGKIDASERAAMRGKAGGRHGGPAPSGS